MRIQASKLVGVGVSAVLLTACQCLPVPESDTTPPTAYIKAEFRDAANNTVTKELTAGSADLLVQVPLNTEVTILFGAGDQQGVRKVTLARSLTIQNPSGSISQGSMPSVVVTGSCPRATLIGTNKMVLSGGSTRYEFSVSSTNWLGQSAATGVLKLKTPN